jgi:hypothetical protein
LLLLRHATKRLEQEQAAAGKAKTFQTLKGFLGDDGDGRAQFTYEQAASSLGLGVPAVTTLIHRLRWRHAQLVRKEAEGHRLGPSR